MTMNRVELLNKINTSGEVQVVSLAGKLFVSNRQKLQLEKYNRGEIPFNRIRDMVTAIANSVEFPTTSQDIKDTLTEWVE